MSRVSRQRIGGLDQRITIQRATTAQDSAGDPVPTWADVVTTWARVDGEKAGGERYVLNGIRSVSDYTFWLRSEIVSRFSVALTDRILWRNKIYNIRDLPDQQDRSGFMAIIAGGGLNRG